MLGVQKRKIYEPRKSGAVWTHKIFIKVFLDTVFVLLRWFNKRAAWQLCLCETEKNWEMCVWTRRDHISRWLLIVTRSEAKLDMGPNSFFSNSIRVEFLSPELERVEFWTSNLNRTEPNRVFKLFKEFFYVCAWIFRKTQNNFEKKNSPQFLTKKKSTQIKKSFNLFCLFTKSQKFPARELWFDLWTSSNF